MDLVMICENGLLFWATQCLISIFSFFLVFKRDFIRYIDFTRIAGSNTASDAVSSPAEIGFLVHFSLKM